MPIGLSINKAEFKTFIEKRENEMKNEKSFIHSKIDFWLDKIDLSLKSAIEKKQKRKEVIDFGKFIYCFNHDIVIDDALCESPDISISLNRKSIGIELTDLVIREREKEREGLLKKLFNQIRDELKKELIEYNGIYHVGFIKDISFNQKNQIKIKSEIINIIKGEIKSGQLVKECRKTRHSDLSIYHSEGWGVGSLNRITVEQKIRKKEEKILNYYSKSFNEIWLLLVIDGASASDDYSYIEDDIIKKSFKTKFNKIFIINFFKSTLFELKTSTKD